MHSRNRRIVVFDQASRPDHGSTAAAGSRSAPDILGLTGRWHESGSFRPDPTNRRLVGEPKIGEVYWCQFTDTVLPEVGKRRPVVVVSRNNRTGRCPMVVPLTTKATESLDKDCVALSRNPNPNGGDDIWAIASQIHSVSHWRLSRYADYSLGRLVTPRVSTDDLDAILRALAKNLPLAA